jgi:protein disulfide-isomerase A6
MALLLPLLPFTVLGEYVELTTDNVDRIIGGSRPVFVKFYLPNCSACNIMALGFSEAATLFPEMTFGGIDCANRASLCERFGVDSWPLLRFFPARNRTWIEYDDGRSRDLFADFIRNHTGLTPRPGTMSHFAELTPALFANAFQPGKCGLAFFHGGRCDICNHMRPQLALLNYIYDGDPNVTVASVDCERYKDFCGVHFPNVSLSNRLDSVRMYAHGRWANFTGDMQLSLVIPRINRLCGVARRSDGLLGDQEGRIAAADGIAGKWFEAEDKNKLVEEMKDIPGTEFYVKVMERLIARGWAGVKEDMLSMRAKLKERKASIGVLDDIKRKYNVFYAFTGKKTARPSETTNEDVGGL